MLTRLIVKSILSIGFMTLFFSCRKDNFTSVDLSQLNPDSTASNTALDSWLKTNFLDLYNIDVIYHTNSYFHEYDRNVTPPDPTKVQPCAQTILSGYFAPYNKIAGETFLKKYGFRQLVFWGSTSYDASKVGYAGTASGGIRINIFGLDGFTVGPSSVPGMLHLIHHEYTHILQQTFTMPSDFQQFTAAYYNGNWTSVPESESHGYGFVSSYASGSPVEDMAETNSSMLVSGPSWFDYWVKTAGDGATGLRQKEASIVNYYNNIGIDYRALQKEVQLYLKDSIKYTNVTFPYWLNMGTPYTSMTVNLSDNMYSQYGQSASFAIVYQNLKDSIKAQTSWLATSIQLMFTSKNTMTLRIPFTYGNGSGSFLGDFDFSMAVDPSTGIVTFAKVANNTGTTYSNGSYFARSVANTIQAYLTNNIFIGDWLLQDKMAANMFTKTAGFYLQNDPSNYFYGTLAE